MFKQQKWDRQQHKSNSIFMPLPKDSIWAKRPMSTNSENGIHGIKGNFGGNSQFMFHSNKMAQSLPKPQECLQKLTLNLLDSFNVLPTELFQGLLVAGPTSAFRGPL